MKRTNSFVWGIILLLIGILLTLSALDIIDVTGELFVPIGMLAVGLIFHLYYLFTREDNEGLLVPGGILLTYGALFLLVALDLGTMGMLWPLFILGPAVGLFELYVFSRGKVGSMVPVFILTAIGGGFLLNNFGIASFQVILAAVLIVLGVGLMASAFFRSGKDNRQYTQATPQPPTQDGVEEPSNTDESTPIL